MFGSIKNYQQDSNVVSVDFDQGQVKIEVITPSIINFFAQLTGENPNSKAVENLHIQPGAVETRMFDGKVEIVSEKLRILVSDDFTVDIYDLDGKLLCADYRGEDHPFIRRGGGQGLELAEQEGHKFDSEKDAQAFKIKKQIFGDTYFYGLGDRTGHLNKHGYRYKLWNTDDPNPHVESFETLYKTIPFFIALNDDTAYGIFLDNTYQSIFDFGKENSDYYYFSAAGGNLDYYFIYGPTVRQTVGGYTYLTGRTPLPQLWTLGYQQSRWSYTPEKRLRQVAQTFRKEQIPCDALHLDIDYMDGFRVFTWDKNKFPDPPKLISDLKKDGFKLVTIIDPGVKKDRNYPIFRQGLKNNYFITDHDGVPYVNRVWPGDALYPDFSAPQVRKWWGRNLRILLDQGVAGIWNDMNEPASFNGPINDDTQFNNGGHVADHREMHNAYGHLMAKATYEGIKAETGKRPFIITRAAYAGTQKYSTVWTGDNQSIWEHLRMALPMLMNLGLSGIGFAGTDVGGFGFDCTPELLARWTQVGAFTPLFRNHSSIFTREQEPWAFGKKTEAIVKKYIQLRYRLLPYLYDLFYQGQSNGLAPIRPLLVNYQNDHNVYQTNDEFMCGDNLLIAPVVEQGRISRLIYLPKGDDWVDFWTNEIHEGGQYVVKKAPLDICPIYVKAGSFLPLYPVQNYVGEKKIDQLTLDVFSFSNDGTNSYRHYHDDGQTFDFQKGIYDLYDFIQEKTGKHLKIKIGYLRNEYQPAYRSFKFVLKGIHPTKITVDGREISDDDWHRGKDDRIVVDKGTQEIDIDLS